MTAVVRNNALITLYALFHFIIHSSSQNVTSSYMVICSDSTIPQSNGTINDTSTQTTLELISIPIKDAATPCYLHISLAEDSDLAFQDAFECSVTFDFKQRHITTNPTSFPTIEPTYEPTKVPSNPPTKAPSLSPTAINITLSPSVSPLPTNITSNPSLSPSKNPTNPPSTAPTSSPTTPLDDIELVHVFNINDENLFWKHSFYNRSYHLFEFLPSCNESSASKQMFAEFDVFFENNATSLWKLVDDAYNNSDYQWSSQIAPNPVTNAGLFPFAFEVYSNEINMSTLSVSVLDTTTPMVKCYYDNLLNTSVTGTIDYYLFPIDLGITEMEITAVTMDITINTVCTERITTQPTQTPSASPVTSAPSAAPTSIDITAALTTSVSSDIATTEEEGWTVKKTEFMIGIGVFALILMIASFVVCFRLKRVKNKIIADREEEDSVEVKEPNIAQKKAAKFQVTDTAHAEMVELARKNSESWSTGLR